MRTLLCRRLQCSVSNPVTSGGHWGPFRGPEEFGVKGTNSSPLLFRRDRDGRSTKMTFLVPRPTSVSLKEPSHTEVHPRPLIIGTRSRDVYARKFSSLRWTPGVKVTVKRYTRLKQDKRCSLPTPRVTQLRCLPTRGTQKSYSLGPGFTP